MSEIEEGQVFSDLVLVTDEMSPPHLPNKVLSTPDMVRLIEATCLLGVQAHLEAVSYTHLTLPTILLV